MAWAEKDIPSQQGKRAIITGTGGLGLEAARALAAKGTDVILAGRNPAKGREAVARITAANPKARITFERLDLASLASVAAFADRMLADGRALDLLVNNAGIAIVPTRRETEDGFELQIGTNHFGHFALTMRLMPLLVKSKAPRVVSLGSSMHKRGTINFDDLQLRQKYSAAGSYAQSKLATLMFAMELDARTKALGLPVISTAAHPGIARTDLMNNGPAGQPVLQAVSHLIERIMGQSAAAGTLPLLRAATDPTVAGGEYFGPSGCAEAKGAPRIVPISSKAGDAGARRRLWEVSSQLTGTDMPLSA